MTSPPENGPAPRDDAQHSRSRRLLGSLVGVWWQPRTAVAAALALGPGPLLVATVWALGAVGAQLLERDWLVLAALAPAAWPLAGQIAASVLVAAVAALATLYGGAALLRVSGRLLGGAATLARLRVALAWGVLPHAWALAYRIPALVLWPQFAGRRDPLSVELEGGLIQIDWSGLAAMPLVPLLLFAFLDAIVEIAGLVVLAKALGEANGFSAWRGLGSWLLALVAFAVVLAVVVILGVRGLAPVVGGGG